MRFAFRWRMRRNKELNEEIQGHLEVAARENMESGLAPGMPKRPRAANLEVSRSLRR